MLCLFLYFCDIVYNCANVDQLDRLQRIQNRCLKHCLKVPRLTSTDFVHQEANLPKLVFRRQYHAQIRGFRLIQVPAFVDHRPLRTRWALHPLLKYILIHSAAYQKCTEVYVAQTWNSLPPEVRGTDTFAEFKSQMKVSLLSTIPRNLLN